MKKSLIITIVSVSLILSSFAGNASAPITSSVTLWGIYAGGSNPGVVYHYTGGTNWEPISPSLGYAVLSLVEYEGQLYAGTMSTSSPWMGVGRIYRYDGNVWTLVGDNMDNQVSSLIVYKGNLYIGTSWNGGKLYKYDSPNNWSLVIDYPYWDGFRSAYVWTDNYLHLGDMGWDKFGRYDGENFYYDQNLRGSCIYDFESYNGELYGSAYAGRLHKSSDGVFWTKIIDYQDGNMWELENFQDYLYMGLDGGQLQKYDGTTKSTVWTAPDGIISMVIAEDKLFFGIGGEMGYNGETSGIGKIYSYDGTGTPALISGELGTGIQSLYYTGILPPVQPDLFISKIEPVQVVYDADINDDGRIDLVKDKETAVLATIKIENIDLLDENQLVDIQLIFGYVNIIETRTVKELKENNVVEFYFTPTLLGDWDIIIKIDPENNIEEVDETNNEDSVGVTVKDTNGLYLIHFPVKDQDGNKPDPVVYQQTVENGGDFILGTYPISNQKFKNEESEEVVSAISSLADSTNIGRTLTMLRLWLLGKRATGGRSDVTIGIVPTGSLGEGNYGFVNAKLLRFGAALVEERYWTVVAHEIGHLQGLWRWKEENDFPEWEEGRPVNGFWVDKKFPLDYAKCFMSWFKSWTGEDWDWLIARAPETIDTWICGDCYKNLFKKTKN